MRRAYHGSTHGAMSMMGAPEGEEWKGAFRPLLPDVQADGVQRFLRTGAHYAPHGLCAGRAGAGRGRRPSARVRVIWKRCGRRCDEVGALLVFDEIQTGMGRTGRTVRHAQIRRYARHRMLWPRRSAGGMPLGAFVARREIMDTLAGTDPVLGHITTFGGHPVCCAAGLAALNYLLDNKVVEAGRSEGRAVRNAAEGAIPPCVKSAAAACCWPSSWANRRNCTASMELFKEAGILSDWFLFCDTAFRISPPLTISGGGGARKRRAYPRVVSTGCGSRNRLPRQPAGHDCAGRHNKKEGQKALFSFTGASCFRRDARSAGRYFSSANA